MKKVILISAAGRGRVQHLEAVVGAFGGMPSAGAADDGDSRRRVLRIVSLRFHGLAHHVLGPCREGRSPPRVAAAEDLFVPAAIPAIFQAVTFVVNTAQICGGAAFDPSVHSTTPLMRPSRAEPNPLLC